MPPVPQVGNPPSLPNQPPASGHRIPLSTSSSTFPDPSQTGPAPCFDSDQSPMFIGSALFDKSVHPCKIGMHFPSHAVVAYGGQEHPHNGRYDLLPFVPEQMEFVRTSYGQIPPGRRPIEGGYEETGHKLYHAVGTVNGVRVPGKTAEHLGGCNIGYGGIEHVILENYEIL
ncbi:hypothetical protein AMATHDRAFT_138897 [Amanita thiersii Skay4041]|uniref:Uncharacterized protein n=1 Tax=Amanita thiersii Skay4041 TaxID=703135 RepID=A0A2A9NS78_9AGAR|nr:hypothetical protein AMATHDRAFT_138897 [Amanita thiersii Skay4041]